MFKVCNIDLSVSLCILLFSWQHYVYGQSRITESEAGQVLKAFTNGGGLDVMRGVLDAVRRLENESVNKQSRLESVFKRRLYYAPTMNLDSLDLNHEMIDETEKMMSSVLYQLYDEWDTIIGPMREAFNLDEMARHNPHMFMYSSVGKMSPIDSIKSNSGTVNETIKTIINGLSSIPKVLTSANDLIDRASDSLESGQFNLIDQAKLQEKIMEKLSKVSENFNFF